jgi:hypothetical protein
MAQLAHFQNIIRNATTLSTKSSKAGDPFLPGSEERIVSADLQASLKTIATNAGVNLLGVRGVQGSRSPQLRMVAVSVELEGPLPAVRDMILAIENQTPFLFVTATPLRSVTDGDEKVPSGPELKCRGRCVAGRYLALLRQSPNERSMPNGRPCHNSGAWTMTSLPLAAQRRISQVVSSPGRVIAARLAAILGRAELPTRKEFTVLRPATRALMAGLAVWIGLVGLVTLVAWLRSPCPQ